jgi:hypothetical protein
MCIFSQPILEVANTQIFARLTGAGTQFLVYQMTYLSQTVNAMVLPLPVDPAAGEHAVRFQSLEEYPDFFDDMVLGFPYRHIASIGCGGPDMATTARLEVQEIGSYIASFVPTVSNFDRLDPAFAVPKSIWDKIPEYHDYGFAVFQLRKLSAKAHPMALEFDTRWPERVFFPTVDIHDGQIHQSEAFDHLLYLQHARFDSVVRAYVSHDVPDAVTGFIRSEQKASEFVNMDAADDVLAPDLLLHRKTLRGEFPNCDQILSIMGNPRVPTVNLNDYRPLLPWALFTAAVAWFLRRRHRLRSAA